MNPFWPYASGFATEDIVPAALELLDEVYVIGMLRAVIPRAGAGWEDLAQRVLEYERREQRGIVSKFVLNGQGHAAIAGRAAYNILRTDGQRVGYSAFAAACDALLQEPGDALGDAWRRAVNSLVDPDA